MNAILIGMKYKCEKGHVWEEAVGGVWLVMPWCPKCEAKHGKRLPAVACKGKWIKYTSNGERYEC